MKNRFITRGVLIVGLGLLLSGASSCVAYRYHYVPDEGFRGGDYYYGGTYWFVPFPFFYYGDHGRPHRDHRPPPQDRPGFRDHRPPERYGPGGRPPR